MVRLSGRGHREWLKDEEIRRLNNKVSNLLKALEPFASFGPDVIGLLDHQAFMGAAGIKAGHFKKAAEVYNSVKKPETEQLS